MIREGKTVDVVNVGKGEVPTSLSSLALVIERARYHIFLVRED